MADQSPVSSVSPVDSQRPVAPHGLDARLRDLAGKPWVWAVIVAVLLALPLIRVLTLHEPNAVPVLGKVAQFKALDQRGTVFGTDDLRGRVWVGGVICTACPYYNPEWTDRLFQVQHRARGLGDTFRIVSLSVNPTVDTPEVLRTWAHDHRASERMWVFATGKPDVLKRAVIGLMNRSTLQGQPLPDPKKPVFNPARAPFVALVDYRLNVRGYYDTRKDEEIDRLMREMKLVANERHRQKSK